MARSELATVGTSRLKQWQPAAGLATRVGAWLKAISALTLMLAMTACWNGVETTADWNDTRVTTHDYLECGEYPGPGSVTVGRGTQLTGFMPVEDGSQQAIELGPNGLLMLQLAILTEGVYPGEPRRTAYPHDPMVATEVWRDDEVVADAPPQHLGLSEHIGVHGRYERSGIFTLFSTARIHDLIGETHTLWASVEDVCGNRATGEVSVLFVGPE